MTIIWKFSTHPRLKDSNECLVVCWVSDRELETNITTLCQSELAADAEFWARLFVQTFECEPLALRHMLAYLEKLGYQAANKVYSELKNFPQFNYDRHDIWQIAWSFSSTPDVFFRKFNFQLPLENYAYKKMEGKIKDEIVRNLGMERKRSDWGLLRYTTRTYLLEALQNKGYGPPHLNCYLLAWESFKEIYAPQRATASCSLPAPTGEDLHMMANLYKQLVESSPQVADLNKANQETIEVGLERCIDALRTYPIRRVVSLDYPTGENENSDPLSETIPDRISESGWEQIEIKEPAVALMAIFRELLKRMDEDTDNCLLLRYGFDLDYRSIAPMLEIYYTTVGHRDKTATRQLLKQVAQWAQVNLDVTLDSESLNEMHTLMKECLKKCYKDLIFRSVFPTAWQQLDCEYQNILYLHDFKQMDVSAIARQLQLHELEVSNGLAIGRQELAAAIKEWIQKRLRVLPDLLNPLADKITNLVQKLIANFPARDFQ